MAEDEQPSIILAPDLASSLIIQQYNKSPVKFYCYSLTKKRIELWTSLSQGEKWIAIPFTQQHTSSSHYEYSLQLNTFHLAPGRYEYTLRYSKKLESSYNDDEPCWSWYGKPGQNGKICIAPHATDPPMAPSFACVPQLKFVAKEQNDIVHLWHFRSQSDGLAQFTLVMNGIANLCCNENRSTWLTPVTGTTHFQDRNRNEKCQLLLYQDAERGDIHLWMPVCQYSDSYLSFAESGSIKLHHTPGKEAHILIVSTAKRMHFAQLIQTALDYYEASIKKASEKDDTLLDTDNNMLDKLGYCTWNAFGQDVNLAHVKAALDSLKKHNIPVEYLMLDDGWQSITGKQQLAGFEACIQKFPDGLSKTVAQLKSDYPFVKYIGVWHALWGYWNGVDQAFAIENKYGWSCNSQNQQEIGIIDDPRAFYDDFYKFLRDSGVAYVKVDNQGSFQELSSTNCQQNIALWDKFRLALSESSDAFLSGRVLHCMALTPHVLNSDDFFPNEKESHSWHIYANAINTLWTSHYPVISDWDMFQSNHPFAEYHASSRALSGGPIYITDIPGKHNVDLINKLVAETKHCGYTILRSPQAPKPTFDTVFNNTMDAQSLIALYNVHQELHYPNEGLKELVTRPYYGVCGFWNTGPHEKLAVVSSELFCCRKLAVVPTVAYVVSGPDRGNIVLLEPSCDHQYDDDSGSIKSVSSNYSSNSSSSTISGNDMSSTLPIWKQSHSTNTATSMMARVGSYGSALVSVSTIQCAGLLSMACLGLLDKFNGIVCILHTSMVQYEASLSCQWYATFEAHLSHRSSSCGFWIKTHSSLKRRNPGMVLVGLTPGRVRVDGYTLDATNWTWSSSNGLLTVDMLAAPSLSDPMANSNGGSLHNDVFRVQVDMCVKPKL
ncbi:glycoside hydrolase family 36 protein [Mucor ambiguus]|uniref:Glycoside hydrolase family 36 protein n=1 Tax=Mucor ambiguus TaxID=91626 RepID=A0A0C9MD79_9FUNG|nr:glycoside hydrolase family 36 protein [Mucor ambiguus]